MFPGPPFSFRRLSGVSVECGRNVIWQSTTMFVESITWYLFDFPFYYLVTGESHSGRRQLHCTPVVHQKTQMPSEIRPRLWRVFRTKIGKKLVKPLHFLPHLATLISIQNHSFIPKCHAEKKCVPNLIWIVAWRPRSECHFGTGFLQVDDDAEIC